ncbi:NAD(P)-dependent dehydrogenase (short-subunit alcohol dehydrogenase family) [Actinokineospora baliensis]|uniref:SDR family NAD(P)-dependent oxidoreductase n=1 Tax=Actinokineospora baliensis TaxID=547056 RepID=UPI00195DE84F|nr:SDR family NAD(P)-dependent oxidoreductase [Actinokineospora baliensis]MBM7773394.1 NAD(P)-dependent dehydrogenase (short-subunit alcohol dehydrogenase family) [Actinokineospora baliensis]
MGSVDGGWRLDGKVALVTGAGSGAGAAIARGLDAAGATVAVLDGDSTGAELASRGLRRGMVVRADVTDPVQVDGAVRAVVDHFGRLDLLVSNAGACECGPTAAGSTMDITDEQWHAALAARLDGTFYATRAALRAMKGQGSGVIVTVAAGCGHLAQHGAVDGAVRGFTAAVARDVAPLGILVGGVAPDCADYLVPDDIAAAVLGLLGPGGERLTGQTITTRGTSG